MDADVDPELVSLFTRAQILQAFPGHKLEDLRGATLVDLTRALQLLDIARKVHS